MFSTDRLAYEAGRITATALYFVIVPAGGRLCKRTISAVNSVAKAHSLKDKTTEVISSNVFNCLQYFD